MAHYLLPCQCGRKTPVDSTKAGRTIECECGAKLEVPTLGGMKKLERIADAQLVDSGSTWGARQRVLLVGVLICAVGLGITGYFWYGRPLPPPREFRMEHIPEHTESLSLIRTLALWGDLERGLPEYSSFEQQAYQKALEDYHLRLGVALFIAVAGLITICISFFVPQKRSRRPRRNLTAKPPE